MRNQLKFRLLKILLIPTIPEQSNYYKFKLIVNLTAKEKKDFIGFI